VLAARLDEIARKAGALGGRLFAANTRVVNWTASEKLRPGMEKFAVGDDVTRGQRGMRLRAAGHAGFLTDQDLYASDDERA
jgi:hypothetical protein